MKIFLYEFECNDCHSTLLLERGKAEVCPYCQGDIDYSNGKIEPVAMWIPRKYKSNANA